MQTVLLLAIAAGLISALLHLSIALGSLGGALLAYLAPLPLFLAGLGLGGRGVLIAGGVATVATALFAGPLTALSILALIAAPIAWLSRLALLSRADAGGKQEWYPVGRLVLWLAVIMAGYQGLALLAALIGGYDPLDRIAEMLVFILGGLGESGGIAADQNAVRRLAAYVPGILAVSWMLMLVINGSLAQGLLQRLGKAIRGTLGAAGFALPRWLLPGFIAAFALALMPETLGMIGKTLAAIAAVPYFLLGLAIVHGYARNWRFGTFALAGLYFLMLLLGWPVAIVVGLGLLEHIVGLRRRAPPGPTRGDE